MIADNAKSYTALSLSDTGKLFSTVSSAPNTKAEADAAALSTSLDTATKDYTVSTAGGVLTVTSVNIP